MRLGRAHSDVMMCSTGGSVRSQERETFQQLQELHKIKSLNIQRTQPGSLCWDDDDDDDAGGVCTAA